MYWYQYLSLAALVLFAAVMLWHFLRLIREGNPKDFSKKTGNLAKAEAYAYTTAMMPNHKETAYLHIPTFTAGALFHLGTFLSILLFVVFFFISPDLFPLWLVYVLNACLLISASCGIGLLIKRIVVKKMRNLSHLDDYLSNFLTTLFQLFTIIYLMLPHVFASVYYIEVSILLLYMPVGKLRHVLYFFAARYHLGRFYGWRNVWPPKN
ncbi:MAG: hypothetical protein J6Y47_06245 [Bacteroidales bacterium]|nr:hypothetical protein [Bacteroidales bacterium]